MKKCLFVYFEKELAGYLTKEEGKLAFQYADTYLSKADSLKLSASLPLQNTAFSHDETEAFFQGLLPEGHAKSVIAKTQKISSKNTFALLEVLGRDCAGSIEIYSSEKDFKASQQAEFDYKTEDEACKILTSLQQRPLYFGDEDFRVSGAGAQDKLIACLIDNQLALPLNGTASTHIFKPVINDLPDSCHNEYFCMLLAKEIGFSVPKVQLLQIKDKIFYCVSRYDRTSSKGITKRIHQEDFCQALGILPDNKYQSDGGPSYEDCFNLLNKISVTGKDKIAFLDLIIYNYIIGNTDAHAKNFSLLYKTKKPVFAPCYDLMSTVIYAPHYPKAKMAMKLMSQNYLISKVSRDSFAKLSEITGFREDFILKRVDDVCKRVAEKAHNLATDLNKENHTKSTVYPKVLTVVDKHIEKISK